MKQACRWLALLWLGPLAGAPSWAQMDSAKEARSEQRAAVLDRAVLRFDRYQLFGADQPTRLKKILEADGVAGASHGIGPASGMNGWFDYDFEIGVEGWYELLVTGSGGGITFIIDPGLVNTHRGGTSVTGANGSLGQGKGQEKIGNLWLTPGAHTLRIQRLIWNGFPQIQRVLLRPSDRRVATRLSWQGTPRNWYRKGQCAPLMVSSGQLDAAVTLKIRVREINRKSASTADTQLDLPLPAASGLQQQMLALPCEHEGRFALSFSVADVPIAAYDLRPFEYEVIDTHSLLESVQGPAVSQNPSSAQAENILSLVEEIDAVARRPDYFGGTEPDVVHRAELSYRQSGERGWIPWQSTAESARPQLPEPSWFAYTLPTLVPQQAYVVEIEFPDDAERTFAAVLRERLPATSRLAYPLSYGAETGAEYGWSNRMQTLRMKFWPRTANPRLVILNALDGKRAAVSKIRIYRIDNPASATILPPLGYARRQFVSWYEEGSNFSSVYGAADTSFASTATAIDRWADTLADYGGTTLMPTVAIYNFTLYPSQVDPVFAAPPDEDVLRRLLLAAEKRGLQVVPELHPRSDWLGFPYAHDAEPKANLLVSKDGATNPMFHNPIDPVNQAWIIDFFGEIADRYRDSPALHGISLRWMPWANPALNNFVSLDWGYDDYTVRQFVRETHAAMPPLLLRKMVGNDDLARQRHDWIIANVRTQWIDWRCDKIVQLYGRLHARITQARGDLRVYSSVFAGDEMASVTRLKEAGLDVQKLATIDGLTLINAQYMYGRRYAQESRNRQMRSYLTDPEKLRMLLPQAPIKSSQGQAYFLDSAGYFEAIDAVVPPEQIGFEMGAHKSWVSTAAPPVGRNSLEHYAIQLAETDAQMLGDGGNMYTFGQDTQRDFLREYTLLPAQSFQRHGAAEDDVAVWARAITSGAVPEPSLYIVNRRNHADHVHLEFQGSGDLVHAASGQRITLERNKEGANVDIELGAYELRVFRTTGNLRLR